MDVTGDELAGVVDLFGGLTRKQLAEALAELAFKRGHEHDPDAFADDIDAAVDSYRLVEVEPSELTGEPATDEPVLVVGPAAFPDLPEMAADLVHILDAPEREIDRETVGDIAAQRYRAEVDSAIDAGDRSRCEQLLEVSYDVEAWAPGELGAERERLNDAT